MTAAGELFLQSGGLAGGHVQSQVRPKESVEAQGAYLVLGGVVPWGSTGEPASLMGCQLVFAQLNLVLRKDLEKECEKNNLVQGACNMGWHGQGAWG